MFLSQVSASLGIALILELDGRSSGALKEAHGPLHVERVPVPVIGVDDERRRDAVAHQLDGLYDFTHGDETDIGTAEPGVRNGCA